MATLQENPIVWIRDINAASASTSVPSSASDGIASPDFGRGNRLHVSLTYTQASGTPSIIVHLWGYALANQQGSADRWVYLGAMNGGTAMGIDTNKWSVDANSIRVAEVFTCSGANYARYKTRVILSGGSTPVITTDIGFVAV